MGLKEKAVIGVKWTGFSMVSTNIVHFVTLIILARLLEPGDFGILGMVMIVIGFTQMFSEMGLGAAVIHKQDIKEGQLSTLFWIDIFVGIVLFSILYMTSPLVAYFFEERALEYYIRISAFIFLIMPSGQLFQNILQKELMFDKLTKVEILRTIAYSASSIMLAFFGWGVLSLIYGQLLSIVFSTCYLFILMKKIWIPSLYFNFSSIRSFISFGFYQMGERSVNYFGANIDYLVIGKFLGAEPLGYYTLAYQLISFPLKKINPMINKVAFPSFAKVQTDNARLIRGYLKVIQYLGSIAFPLLMGIFVVAPEFVPLLYGESWLPSVRVIQILSLVGIIKALGSPIGSLLLAKGRADLGFKWNVFAVFIFGVAIFVGVRWGIEGVAMGILVVSLFILFPLGFYLRNLLVNMSAKDYLSVLKVPFISSSVMLIIVYLLRHLMIGLEAHLIAGLAAQIIVGAICYICLYYLYDRDIFIEVKQMVKMKGQ